MARPLLSVVVPAYQVAQFLPECLASVRADPGPNLEVIVVDDHSPDPSGRIAEAHAAGDPRVRVIHLATNVGLGRARNTGLARARGEYVWFVDGDDWLPGGAVAAVRAQLAATRPDVLVVDHVEVLPGGARVSDTPAGVLAHGGQQPGPLSQRPRLLWLAHSACTKVVRRDLLAASELRFPPGWYEDVAFTYPLLLAADRIDVLDRVAYCYRKRATGAITASTSDRHFDVFAQWERVWQAVAAGGDGYRRHQPALFARMVDHLLVIAGNDRRLPARLRRPFFHRLAREYRRWRPAGGYPVPGGMAGLRHRLAAADAYRTYAALRLARRLTTRAAGPVLARWRSAGRGRHVVPVDDQHRVAPAPTQPPVVAGDHHPGGVS